MKAELLELAMANGSLPEHELEALLVNAMKEKLVALGRNVGSEASNNGRPEIGVASNEADEGSEGWNEDASMEQLWEQWWENEGQYEIPQKRDKQQRLRRMADALAVETYEDEPETMKPANEKTKKEEKAVEQ